MKLPIPLGNPTTYAGHSGVDFGQRRGTIFRASGNGTVKTLGRNARGGFYIWVHYDHGPLVGYHHMDSHEGCPPVNSRVSEGSQLGYVGNTGNSKGPHLHSEVSGYATTDGYWRFFDKSRVVGTPVPAAPVPKPEIKFHLESELKMHEALIQHIPTNKLLIVNLKDHTIIDLGANPKSALRSYYANNFKWVSMTGEEWQERFNGWVYVMNDPKDPNVKK